MNGRKVIPFSYLSFFNDLGQYLNDAYYIVLHCIGAICIGKHVIKEQKLVTELHHMIKSLYEEGIVRKL